MATKSLRGNLISNRENEMQGDLYSLPESTTQSNELFKEILKTKSSLNLRYSKRIIAKTNCSVVKCLLCQDDFKVANIDSEGTDGGEIEA